MHSVADEVLKELCEIDEIRACAVGLDP